MPADAGRINDEIPPRVLDVPLFQDTTRVKPRDLRALWPTTYLRGLQAFARLPLTSGPRRPSYRRSDRTRVLSSIDQPSQRRDRDPVLVTVEQVEAMRLWCLRRDDLRSAI